MMVQLRWYKVSQTLRGSELDHTKKLQYRQKIDTTVRAGMWSNMKIIETANYQWTEWQDVPEVWDVAAEE